MIIFYLVAISETVRSFKLEDETTKEGHNVGYKNLKTSEQLFGKTMDEANEMIRNEQIFHEGQQINEIRVRVEDGVGLSVNYLHRFDRINVEISNQKINKIQNLSK